MQYATHTKAKAIVYAALHTDEQAADKYGCSRRTIINWRNELEENQKLQEACTRRWEEVRESESWVQDATHTLQKAQAFIRQGAEEMDASDPHAQKVMGKNLRIIAEYLQMARIVDARLGTDRHNGEAGGQDDARGLPEGTSGS